MPSAAVASSAIPLYPNGECALAFGARIGVFAWSCNENSHFNMPETRRSRRIQNAEDESSNARVRLTAKPDSLLSSPEFTTDLYSTHTMPLSRPMMARARMVGSSAMASSSNAMDVDGMWSVPRSPYFSDEDSGSDGENAVRSANSSARDAAPRRKYTRRPDPASSGTCLRPSISPFRLPSAWI